MKNLLKTYNFILGILLFSIFIININRCYKPNPEEYPPCEAVSKIYDEAYYKTGKLPDGSGYVLPNGRWITPLGKKIQVDDFPLSLILTPDEKYLIISNSGRHDHVLTVIDTEKEEIIGRYVVPALFIGLVMNSKGDRLYASGGDSIYEFSFIEGELEYLSEILVNFVPVNMAISKNDLYLFSVNQMSGELEIIDLSTKTLIGNAYVGGRVYDLAISPDESSAYVSSTMDNYVGIVDISNKTRPRLKEIIPVGKNPEDLVLTNDGEMLFVAISDIDKVLAISTSKKEVIYEIDVMADYLSTYGTTPNSLALSNDQKYLYITCANENRIDIFNIINKTFVGSLPTAWYPSDVAINKNSTRLYVSNAKGVGTINNLSSIPGLITIIDLEDAIKNILHYTEMTRENNLATSRYFELNEECKNFPVPIKKGNNTPINHVIYILRENKTYDAIFGDFEKGDGDPSLTLFGEWFTPNIHQLAREFVLLDNFYNNAEESTAGHEWSLAGNLNDYVTKNLWPVSRGDRGTDGEAEFYVELFLNPVTYPEARFIFQNCLNNNVPLMIYGETLGTGEGCLRPDMPPGPCLFWDERYVNHGPKYPPYFNTMIKDVVKIEEVIENIERGKFPPFVWMSLPNDHTMGTTPGAPTPASMVADNDEATGKFIDYISHSPYWKETLIIILEDDPQQGRDHVEPHRTLCVLVSPYVKRGYISSVHYSEVNLLKTIEMILNLSSMSIHDETAQALYDVFTSTPDFTPYNAIPRNVPEETNPKDAPFAEESLKMNFSIPDANRNLNEVIWHVMKEYKKTN